MLSVAVIDIPAAAMVALDPVRSRLLHELSEPASAAALSARLGIARQKINYHLRALEAHQMVRVAGERRGGGLTERVLGAVGPAATDPDRNRDRLSAGYLISLAARVIREVRDLLGRSEETGKCLPTLFIDTVICCRSPAERAAFSNELSTAVARLAARYHDSWAPGRRAHRLVIVTHPLFQKISTQGESYEQ